MRGLISNGSFGGPYNRLNAAVIYGDDAAWGNRGNERSVGLGRMGADYSVGADIKLPELTSVSNILRADMEKTFAQVNAMPEPLNMKKAALYALAAVALVVVARAVIKRHA